MRKSVLPVLVLVLSLPLAAGAADEPNKAQADWALNATIIEACSCPMFCQCYFNDEPAAHHDHATGQAVHYCRGNLAFRVNHGHYGTTKLDGAKFWFAGDLGNKLTEPGEWGVVTFDPAVTAAQREGILAIIPRVYPTPMKEFKVGKDAPIDWTANKDRATAKLDGGNAAEVVLRRLPGNSNEPVVIRNLRYIGAPRNDGFVLMPNEIEAWKLGEKAFAYHNTNGFMITFDITSKDPMVKMGM
ncbi:MAG TPA: DUF1326 domain-containing protein [Burkholderiales bacterium]|nr:DUF1326 domain-containing protein [Burkholderiales bacterium]